MGIRRRGLYGLSRAVATIMKVVRFFSWKMLEFKKIWIKIVLNAMSSILIQLYFFEYNQHKNLFDISH